MDECIFCRIVKGEMPSFTIYEDETVLAFEDINPVSAGHTLIVPKQHAQDLWEISDDDLAAIHLASKKIIHAIREALEPTGVACVQLNGPGVNQVVRHYHLHLIPRMAGTPELPVSSWEIEPGDMASIRETADRIAAAIR